MITKPYHKKRVLLPCLGLVILAVNIALWFTTRPLQAQWLNIPPAPSQGFAAAYGLGDNAFSYRLNGLMLQNFGDSGGRTTALKDYNYDRLASWFFAQDTLDPRSVFTPYLAGYFFSALQTPEKFRPVIDYLVQVGRPAEGGRWRFLLQAVYLSRYVLKDDDLALTLAHLLAAHPDENLPAWGRQMPAFIMADQGQKEAAYAMLVGILRSEGDMLHPAEVNTLVAYLCERVLTDDEAAQDPICSDD